MVEDDIFEDPPGRSIRQYPHCDSRILHTPGACQYCDRLPDWQELRTMWGINFTGEKVKGRSKCPAEKARSLKTINRWYGNVPHDAKREKELKAYYKELGKALKRLDKSLRKDP